MGLKLYLETELCFSDITKKEIKSKIEETQDLIRDTENRLFMCGACTPKDICNKSEEEDDILSSMKYRISGLLEDYQQDIINLFILEKMSENIKKVEQSE